jgi:hypothetical protein
MRQKICAPLKVRKQPEIFWCHRADENQPPMGDSKPATLRRELHITYSIWFKGKTGLFAWSLFWLEKVAAIRILGWFPRAGSVCLFARLGG